MLTQVREVDLQELLKRLTSMRVVGTAGLRKIVVGQRRDDLAGACASVVQVLQQELAPVNVVRELEGPVLVERVLLDPSADELRCRELTPGAIGVAIISVVTYQSR